MLFFFFSCSVEIGITPNQSSYQTHYETAIMKNYCWEDVLRKSLGLCPVYFNKAREKENKDLEVTSRISRSQ